MVRILIIPNLINRKTFYRFIIFNFNMTNLSGISFRLDLIRITVYC